MAAPHSLRFACSGSGCYGFAIAHSLTATRLRRALRNLIENARRYGGDDVDVQVSLEGTRATVRVCDRGPGVPEEALNRLFEPFYRPEAARGRTTGGSGLGLFL